MADLVSPRLMQLTYTVGMEAGKFELDREVCPSALLLHQKTMIDSRADSGTGSFIAEKLDLPDHPVPDWVHAKIASFHTRYAAHSDDRISSIRDAHDALGNP